MSGDSVDHENRQEVAVLRQALHDHLQSCDGHYRRNADEHQSILDSIRTIRRMILAALLGLLSVLATEAFRTLG